MIVKIVVSLCCVVSYLSVEAFEAIQYMEKRHFEMGFQAWHTWEEVEKISGSMEGLIKQCELIFLDYYEHPPEYLSGAEISINVPITYMYHKTGHTPHTTVLKCHFQWHQEEDDPILTKCFIKGPENSVFSVSIKSPKVITIKKWFFMNYILWSEVFYMDTAKRLETCEKILRKFLYPNPVQVTDVKLKVGSVHGAIAGQVIRASALWCTNKNDTRIFMKSIHQKGSLVSVTNLNKYLNKSNKLDFNPKYFQSGGTREYSDLY